MPVLTYYPPLWFDYHLQCQFDGHRQVFSQAVSAGWIYGTLIPQDPSHPDVGQCLQCKRYEMKVLNQPEPPPPEKPVGWDKIPTE